MIKIKKGNIITIYYNILINNKIKKLFFKGEIINIKGKKKIKSIKLLKKCNNIFIKRIFFLKQNNIINIIKNN
ncbi:MAG: 50S ribosomal protein L19 [Candidatus Shikimatogenerans sp. Tser]|uniref:Large ribosomal subunit protein bL19 n=1 Tax=Candidatus Shikimatogenerans sp. Tser TaxID=3158568 RepID=A0AAU7QQZ1_9FLAO